jgi:hypothetical protein
MPVGMRAHVLFITLLVLLPVFVLIWMRGPA